MATRSLRLAHTNPYQGRAKAFRNMVRQAHHDSRPINSRKQKRFVILGPSKGARKPYAIWFDKLTMTAARLTQKQKRVVILSLSKGAQRP
jgi:hypothetical protein